MHIFDAETILPAPREELFAFFSNALKLQEITPPWLHFRVVTPTPIEMREGTLIDYRLRLRGVPMTWRTLISRWDPPHCFVDEQLRGPYRLWRHRHEFEEHAGGTLMRDHVEYRVPLDRLVHRWLVRPDIEKIFAYRATRLARLFPGTPS